MSPGTGGVVFRFEDGGAVLNRLPGHGAGGGVRVPGRARLRATGAGCPDRARVRPGKLRVAGQRPGAVAASGRHLLTEPRRMAAAQRKPARSLTLGPGPRSGWRCCAALPSVDTPGVYRSIVDASMARWHNPVRGRTTGGRHGDALQCHLRPARGGVRRCAVRSASSSAAAATEADRAPARSRWPAPWSAARLQPAVIFRCAGRRSRSWWRPLPASRPVRRGRRTSPRLRRRSRRTPPWPAGRTP